MKHIACTISNVDTYSFTVNWYITFNVINGSNSVQ